MTETAPNIEDGDYGYSPTNNQLSKCSSKIVAYIAGFVVHTLQKVLHCETCISALTLTEPSVNHSVIQLKTKGCLVQR